MQKQKFTTLGQEGCADCEWLADETDGETLICRECDFELNGFYDDGQPDELTEWMDFDPDC